MLFKGKLLHSGNFFGFERDIIINFSCIFYIYSHFLNIQWGPKVLDHDLIKTGKYSFGKNMYFIKDSISVSALLIGP